MVRLDGAGQLIANMHITVVFAVNPEAPTSVHHAYALCLSVFICYLASMFQTIFGWLLSLDSCGTGGTNILSLGKTTAAIVGVGKQL
jgi:hypothetical protein